jgi:hypothetical protein
MPRQKQTRVSDYFRLNKRQSELDFVDVPEKGDVTLFLDPYAFTLENDPWFVECNDLVIDFFAMLVESIRAGCLDKAELLLSNLHEPDDTHLGFSRGNGGGRGIGRDQAGDLLNAMKKSKAVETGSLNDLSDCELLIPGISGDKISDITTNILRGKLIEYTQEQCNLHGIPMSNVQGGVHWDLNKHGWVNRYADRPLVNNKPLLLVPKVGVRFHPEITAEEFYEKFVLDYLKAEHIRANDSLVQTLKNGSRKVLKKDLKAQHPFSKEYLFDFSQEHPEILQAYKNSVRDRSRPPRDEDLEMSRDETREVDYLKLATQLEAIPTGAKEASTFHNFIFGVLQTIFYPSLRLPKKEQEVDDGRKRIDISFSNGAREGFFAALRSNYEVLSPFVFFECKNYSVDPANPELDQLCGRFTDKRGKFGIMVCRKIRDKELMLKRCRDVVHGNRGWVLVIDDADIKFLLRLKSEGKNGEINDFMNSLMAKLLL